MKQLQHYMLPENTNKLYENEARSSISLTRDVADKINELVDAYNQLAKIDLEWKQEQDGRVRGAVVYMKDNLQNSIDDLMQMLKSEGFIDRRIQEHIENLIERLDNLLGSITEGSTTLDAELIDIRVDTSGKTHVNAGAAVREIGKLVNGLLSNNINIYPGLNWENSKAINTSGNLYTAGSPNFKVASICLNKGTKIEYRLFGNSELPVIASGDFEKPLSIIDTVPEGSDSSTPVDGEYLVSNDSEVLWFSTTQLQDDNAYIKITLPTNDLIGWTKSYISNTGELVTDNVYGTTDVIFVPAGHKITASLMASDSVAAISKCDADGNYLGTLRRGRNGALANVYSYYATEDSYVRLSTRISNNGTSMTVSSVNIKIEEIEKYYTPTFTVGNGHINVADMNVRNDSVYMYSDLIHLDKGMTIHFFSSGSSAMYALSRWNDSREFVSGLIEGNTRHREITYTAQEDMIVRISAKKVQSGTEAVTTEEEFLNCKIYSKDIFYKDIEKETLFNKSITFFGDSLAYGNIIGQDAVWSHLLALKYNMQETNLGINGNTVARQNTETTNPAMIDRYTSIPESDYIVLIGGANDKRLNVALEDFKDALITIIDGMRAMHPKAKLLFLTNYNRFPNSQNSLGLNDIDYVDAMLEVCSSKGVKCFDNFRESGVTFADWMDEGVSQGTTANKHISREGYNWILPIYENILRGL